MIDVVGGKVAESGKLESGKEKAMTVWERCTPQSERRALSTGR